MDKIYFLALIVAVLTCIASTRADEDKWTDEEIEEAQKLHSLAKSKFFDANNDANAIITRTKRGCSQCKHPIAIRRVLRVFSDRPTKGQSGL